MNQQSQRQEPQQEKAPRKVLSWLDQRLIGPLIGALITAIVAGRVVIQITGVQFNIGLMVLVTLVMFMLAAVKSLCTFAKDTGVIGFNVGAAQPLPQGKDKLTQRILSQAQVQRMLYVAEKSGNT